MNPRALTNAFNLKLIKNKLALSLFHIFSPTNKDQGQIDQSATICLSIRTSVWPSVAENLFTP